MQNVIKPTVGRNVWFRQSIDENEQPQPHAAIIVYVHSDNMVNLTVFDSTGVPSGKTSVPLIQDGEERPSGYFCEWMPYQKGQAAKTEALQSELNRNTA